jgi:hypothetical protein
MLENHGEKTSHPLKSPSISQASHTDTCNIDTAPETSGFDFNGFKIARIGESHTEQSSPCRWEDWGIICPYRYSKASFNENGYANQRHGGCPYMQEDRLEQEQSRDRIRLIEEAALFVRSSLRRPCASSSTKES